MRMRACENKGVTRRRALRAVTLRGKGAYGVGKKGVRRDCKGRPPCL